MAYSELENTLPIEPSIADCFDCRYSSAREAGSACARPGAPAPMTTNGRAAASPATTIPKALRAKCMAGTSRGSRLHLAEGSSPPEADLPSRAGVECAHRRPVSWLADDRRRPPSPRTRSRGGRWPEAPRSPLRDSAGLTPASRHLRCSSVVRELCGQRSLTRCPRRAGETAHLGTLHPCWQRDRRRLPSSRLTRR